jgi:ABC-type branched-subunit amino acid transport system substrate-binding protein
LIRPERLVSERSPDLINRLGVITSSFGSVLNVRDDTVFAAEQLGYEVVFSEEYNSAGESNWRPFVERMRDADVQVLEFVGEPTFFSQVLEAMEAVPYRPEMVLLNANFYDQLFADTAGSIAQGVHVRSAFTPFELADENQATADYLELMERYNPGGKTALLGMQALSAYLLFAQSAAACGAELTRTCLIEQAGSVTEWTGGGLHAPTNPGASEPTQCFVTLDLDGDHYVVNEELTQPTDGIFNCSEDNVVDVPTA